MKSYTLMIGGLPHTVQLDDDEAKRYGDAVTPVEAKQAPQPQNKARKPVDKG